MEVLRDLQASLAQLHGQKFEQAEERLKGLLAQQYTSDNQIHKARLEERDRECSALNQEIEFRGAKIKDLEGKLQDLDKWHERALEAETLREDNAELQRELEVMKAGSRAIPAEDNGHEELLRQIQDGNHHCAMHDSPEEHGVPDTIPYASYTELVKRYRKLFREMRTLVKAFTTLRAQHRTCKDTVRSWHNLFDKKTFTISVKQKPVTFRRVGDGELGNFGRSQLGRTAGAIGQEPTSRPHLDKPVAPSTFTDQLSVEEVDLENVNNHPELHRPPLLGSVAALNSTPLIKMELEVNDDGAVQEIPSSTPALTLDIGSDNFDNRDLQSVTPITSTATMLGSSKRKQHPAQSEEVPAMTSIGYFPDCDSNNPISVKSEQPSSSPLQNLMQQRELNNLDTQDLDEVDNSVQTPRKKKARSAFDITDSPFSILQDEGSSNSTRRTRISPQLGVQVGGNKPNIPTVLQPKDCNTNVVPRPPAGDLGHDAKRRRSDRRGGAEAIPTITEDGEDDLYSGTRKSQGGPRKAKVRESARLNDLLEAHSSPKMALTPRPAPKTVGAKGFVNSSLLPRDHEGYGQLSLVTPSKPAASNTSAPARQAISTDTPLGGTSKKPDRRRTSAENARLYHDADRNPQVGEPYRSRTVDRLSLDSFKINPDRNEGVDYAFDDVVRKRDHRQCLPGCSRPDCCGSRFRVMAKVGGLSVLSGRKSTDEDQEILENYLGDRKYRLKAMNEDERFDLLIDAKAEALAARYGRHRYAHERHHSPPGFWRADMPSTQELEEDREQARRMEREKVESRYREAMRPSGMWKFADE